MTSHALSQRRACALIGITGRGFQRAPVGRSQSSIAATAVGSWPQRGPWHCPMLYLMLRREGRRAYDRPSSGCIALMGCRYADGGGANA